MIKSRAVTLIFVAIGAVAFFAWLTNTYVFESSADVSKIDILTSPSTGALPSGNVNFIFQPQSVDGDQKISAVDLVIEVQNGALDEWEGCKTIEPAPTGPDEAGETRNFSELLSQTGKSARYACVIVANEEELPNNVIVSGKFSCSGTDPMTIVINEDKTQASGPVEGDLYEIDEIVNAEFACDGNDNPKGDEDMIVSFEPSDCNTDIGGVCTYDVNVNPRNGKDRISGVYMKMSYDENVLNFHSIIPDSEPIPIPLPGSDDPMEIGSVGDVQGLIAQAGTDPTATPSPSPSPTPAGTTNTPTPTPDSSHDVTPTTTPTTTPGLTVPPATATPSLTQTPSPTTYPTPDPTFGPTAEPTITGMITPTIPVKNDCEMVAFDVQEGIVELMYICDMPANQLPISFSDQLGFGAVGDGQGELVIESVQIVGPDVIGAYSVKKNRATYTVGGGSHIGNIELDMKLRLQCVVNKKPKRTDTITARIGIKGGPLGRPIYKVAEFISDDKGIFHGTVRFNAPPGAGYTVLTKGEMHMQRKFCEASPKENFPGANTQCGKGQIILKEGSNTIDLSGVVQLTGDIPPGEQDGISNAKDHSLVRNLMGKRDEESAELADLNYDGVVNAVDHSCMIAALSIRWDEQ